MFSYVYSLALRGVKCSLQLKNSLSWLKYRLIAFWQRQLSYVVVVDDDDDDVVVVAG